MYFFPTFGSVYKSFCDKLKLTKNPGVGQTIYSNKSSAIVGEEEGDGLRITLNPGAINTTATQIIVDEADGV